MKKFAIILMTMCLVLGMTACGEDTKEPEKQMTAEELLTSLKEKVPEVGEIVVYTEETDPNENLGRPGEYIGKADFEDTTLEQLGEYLCGGTIEVFSSKSDCSDRYKYLSKMSDPELGAFGVNQYIFKYDLVIFRVDYDVPPSKAEEYKTAMDEIIGEVSEQYGKE